MNRFLRDNGFGVALALGVALLVFGLATGNPAALVIAVVMLVIGVSGEVGLAPKGDEVEPAVLAEPGRSVQQGHPLSTSSDESERGRL